MKNKLNKLNNFNIWLSRTLNGKYQGLITFCVILVILFLALLSFNLYMANKKVKEEVKEIKLEQVVLRKEFNVYKEVSVIEFRDALAIKDDKIDSLKSIEVITKVVFKNELKRMNILYTKNERLILNMHNFKRYLIFNDVLFEVDKKYYNKIDLQFYGKKYL